MQMEFLSQHLDFFDTFKIGSNTINVTKSVITYSIWDLVGHIISIEHISIVQCTHRVYVPYNIYKCEIESMKK